MKHWRWILKHYPPVRVIPHRVPADCWNAVRLALRRRQAHLRLELAGLRGMWCELHDPAWLVWAVVPEKRPLLLWTAFEKRRMGLDVPVASRLHLYHVHAGLVIGPVLEAIQVQLR